MSTFFLGLIAVSAVVMAAVQVGLIIFVARLSNRIDGISARVEREVGPLAERLKRIADNLQHATSLANVQVERVDRLLSSAARRADDTMALVQGAVVGPIREGLAVIAAVRGVLGAVRSFRGGGSGRPSARFDDEDPLFIG